MIRTEHVLLLLARDARAVVLHREAVRGAAAVPARLVRPAIAIVAAARRVFVASAAFFGQRAVRVDVVVRLARHLDVHDPLLPQHRVVDAVVLAGELARGELTGVGRQRLQHLGEVEARPADHALRLAARGLDAQRWVRGAHRRGDLVEQRPQLERLALELELPRAQLAHVLFIKLQSTAQE